MSFSEQGKLTFAIKELTKTVKRRQRPLQAQSHRTITVNGPIRINGSDIQLPGALVSLKPTGVLVTGYDEEGSVTAFDSVERALLWAARIDRPDVPPLGGVELKTGNPAEDSGNSDEE